MVYVLLGTGFEETEAVAPIDLLRRAGVEVKTVGVNGRIISGSHGIGIEADVTLEEMEPAACEMIVLPGGLKGVASIRASKTAMDALLSCWNAGKYVAAICAGPTVLADLHIPDEKHATCYPGCETQMGKAIMVSGAAAVQDGRLITGTSAGCAVSFGLKLIEALKGPEIAKKIADQIVIR